MSLTKGVVVHVIDDDADVRCGFSRLLRSAGHEVRDYESAELFLDAIEEAEPGCVMLDVTMPGMTGAEMLARLKDKQSSLPVIVVSARDNESIHGLARELGAKMFLRKPVDDQALLDAINWVTQARADR
ncbi:MAG: response regulator [Mizugakiibacter sp.]|uniref:response regulator transcription factor n=1 Tax=Mizugakiibacter sp. TaxID=1972610 RepID=UPI0031C8BFD6|nr:response regulator [Xanthomonadaceae bacterium]